MPSFGFLVIYRSLEGSLLALGLIKENLQLLLGGGLLLLHQVSMAFGDTPPIGFRHRGAEGTARRRVQLLPVITAGPTGRKELGFV